MVQKTVSISIIALLVGLGAGYFARTSEVSALENNVAKAIESKGMLQAELDAVKAKRAVEGKAVAIPFEPEPGLMFHDGWLLITQRGDGKFTVVIRSEGFDKTGPEDAYLIEGVTRTEPMQMVPIGTTLDASVFHADQNGHGFYWIVLDKDPRVTFDKILILYLPGMSMERAALVATAKLG